MIRTVIYINNRDDDDDDDVVVEWDLYHNNNNIIIMSSTTTALVSTRRGVWFVPGRRVQAGWRAPVGWRVLGAVSPGCPATGQVPADGGGCFASSPVPGWTSAPDSVWTTRSGKQDGNIVLFGTVVCTHCNSQWGIFFLRFRGFVRIMKNSEIVAYMAYTTLYYSYILLN